MNYNQRKGVIEKLEYLEKEFPVESWKLYGIHVWPILKMRLFFDEFHELNKKNSPHKGVIFFQRISNLRQRIKRLVGSIDEIAKIKLEKAEFVFSGAHTHRVWYSGKFINRYFDPMICYLDKKNILSRGFEYSSLKDLAIPYIKVDKTIPLFRFGPVETDALNSDKNFAFFLEEVERLFGTDKQAIITTLSSTVRNIIQWKRQYLYIFKKVQPKYCFGLCYYSIPMWGMNAAAKELGIVSVDLQHGTQGRLHAAYTYGKVPEEGYNVLPKEFWCWDEESYEQILSWTKDSFHQVKLSGNPWFEFLLLDSQEAKEILPQEKPTILYTHQPLRPLIDGYLMETIKITKPIYNWWIRLHPRITDKERIELLEILHENGLLDFVEIEKATKLPLPVLLHECSLHISKFSGSIIEAALIGTPSIILEETGVNTFENIISKGKAIGIKQPTTDLLVKGIKEGLNIKIAPLGKDISFKFALDDILG